jgi:hypothetical protein
MPVILMATFNITDLIGKVGQILVHAIFLGVFLSPSISFFLSL